MKKDTVRNIVAAIVIIGHLVVFILALSLGVFAMLVGTDAIQTLLMASPILAVTALAAFTNIIDESVRPSETVVTKPYAFFVILFPSLLIGIVCSLFLLFWLQIDHFGPDQLKTTLGAVETFFGAFIGALSKALFGGNTPSPL